MTSPITVGRYLLHHEIARGGMATIHIAHLVGDVGFSRIVAAKRLLPELTENHEFVQMFLDEARVASKVHHRNIVPVLDVVTAGREVVLVQEFVRGAPLSRLLSIAHDAKTHVPLPVAASIACQVLAALQAAHETVDEVGMPLRVVHRDVSPQNIMVATDGTARLLDFGVAKAAAAAHVTKQGTFKGKLAYSAPEHIRGSATHQSDIYSLSVVLWELVTGQRLRRASDGITKIIEQIMTGFTPTITSKLTDQRAFISSYRWKQLESLEPIVRKGLSNDPRRRWTTAQEMEEAIASAVPLAPGTDVAAWLQGAAREFLEEREKLIAEVEAVWRSSPRAPSPNAGELAVRTSHAELPVVRASDNEIPVSRTASPAPEDLAIAIEAIDPGPPPRLTPARLARAPLFAIGGALACVIGVAISWFVLGSKPPVRHPAPAVAAAVTAIAPKPAKVARLDAVPERCEGPPAPETPAPAAIAPKPEPPAPVRTVRPPPKRVFRIAKPASAKLEPAPAPAPAPAVVAPKKVDCNPPYYYEGAKKVFKPACV